MATGLNITPEFSQDMADISRLGGTEVFGSSDASSSSMSGYTGYAATITMVSHVAQGFAETEAFKSQLKNKTNTDKRNAGYLVDNFELQRAKARENVNAINSALGDKLSERGLTAMKEAALLKVASAETGTSGGTTAGAVEEAFLNANMDRANITQAAKNQLKGVYSNMEMEENSVRNRVDSLLIGGGVVVNTNPLIAGLQGGLSVGTGILDMIPMQERVKAFGIEPDDYNV